MDCHSGHIIRRQQNVCFAIVYAYNRTEVTAVKENRIEVRHYNRNGEIINVSSDEFRVQLKRITEAVIKRLLELS